jgi:hypothetical protein
MIYEPNTTQALRARATLAAERQARYVAQMLAVEVLGFLVVIILELIR